MVNITPACLSFPSSCRSQIAFSKSGLRSFMLRSNHQLLPSSQTINPHCSVKLEDLGQAEQSASEFLVTCNICSHRSATISRPVVAQMCIKYGSSKAMNPKYRDLKNLLTRFLPRFSHKGLTRNHDVTKSTSSFSQQLSCNLWSLEPRLN